MKITVFLLFVGFLQLSATTYSQNTKLDLSFKEASLREVFEEIERQSDLRFLFRDNIIDSKQHVTINMSGTVDEILKELTKDNRIEYQVLSNNLVVISNATSSEISTQQQKSVSGKVTDSSGQPIPGVSVVIKGTNTGIITDANGNYSLPNVPVKATLMFSFVGMKTQEVVVENKETINVILSEETVGIEEVVAIGYGTQKKANVIGSISTVRSKELTAAPVGRISNSLAGRLPGATFTQGAGGEPGNDEATIRIRGNSTFGENGPLIVIDGIPGRDLNSLNPEDIESLTVLKDASAAIYGARAANGVILIITKGGTEDKPATFSYNFYEGRLSPTRLPEMTDAPTYATMIREMQSYRNVAESNMMFSEEDIAKYKSGEYPWTHPNTDWFADALKDYSTTRHHNFSVSGGTKNVSYYGSFGTQFDDGIYTNSATSYNRYNLKVNIQAKINEYLSVGFNITGIEEDMMYSTQNARAIYLTGLMKMLPTSHSLFPGTNLPGPDIESGRQPMVISSFETGFDDDKQYRSNNLLSATLKIPWVQGLKLSGYYAYDMYFQRRKFLLKPWTLYSLNEDAYLAAGNTGKEDGTEFLVAKTVGGTEPSLTNYSAYKQSKTANIKLDYENTFNEVHNIQAFIAYEQNEFNRGGFDAYRRYFISDKLPYLFAGGDAEKNNSEYVGLDASANYFGRLSYNYASTYFFQFSFRRDGSLRFSEESRWGNFPSVLVGYKPSEQQWWKNNLKFINDFKLRMSWGQMGNDQITPFQYLTSYGFSTGYTYGTNLSYSAGLNQSNVPNPNITWEVANVYNLGWEARMFNSKLTFESDFFYEKRTNILVKRDVSVPQFTGMTLPDENFGIVENRGLELLLAYRDGIGDFKYGVSGNFAFARNKIIEADEPAKSVPWQTLTGKPMGSVLLYKSMGIFKDAEHVESYPHVSGARPGDIIIEDYSGDGIINTDDQQLFQYAPTPEISFGFTFDVSYKNWQLKGLIQGQARAMRNMYTQVVVGTAGNYMQYDADDRWTPEHTDGTKPRAFERQEEYWRGSYLTDYILSDVSFARLKNLQLSYTLPQKLTSQVKLKNAQIYFSGQNLWMIYSGHKMKYMDPERDEVGAYPIMSVLSVGAEITF